MKKPIEITGVWLRIDNEYNVKVLVEVNGIWKDCINDTAYPLVSHICEPLGIRKSPPDKDTEGI